VAVAKALNTVRFDRSFIMRKPEKAESLPVLRVCPHCGHEFHTDGVELGTREPVPCPKCQKPVEFTLSSHEGS
jgi:hypothetical protein